MFLAAASNDVDALLEEINKLTLTDKTSEISKADPKTGASPLHVAANRGSLKAVKFLLEHDAEIDARDRSGVTPLFAAVSANQTEIVEKLVNSKASVNIRDCDGLSSLHEAANNGDKVNDPNLLHKVNTCKLITNICTNTANSLATMLFSPPLGQLYYSFM